MSKTLLWSALGTILTFVGSMFLAGLADAKREAKDYADTLMTAHLRDEDRRLTAVQNLQDDISEIKIRVALITREMGIREPR